MLYLLDTENLIKALLNKILMFVKSFLLRRTMYFFTSPNSQKLRPLIILSSLMVSWSFFACDDSDPSSDEPVMIISGTDNTAGASAGTTAGMTAGTTAGNNTAGEMVSPMLNPEGFLAKLTIDDMARGPAFSTLADFNNDGKLDILISEFGPVGGFTIEPGELTIYYQGDSLDAWTSETVTDPNEPIYWPNEVQLADLDGDGDLDLTVGTGFLICEILGSVDGDGNMQAPAPCGGLLWYEQSEDGWIRHDIVGPDNELFYHHGLVTDLDGDGIDDLIAVGERRYFDAGNLVDIAETQWFKGQAMGPRFESTPRVIGPGMGSLAELHDLDQDGDIDIVSAEFFADFENKSFAWYEQVTPPNATEPNGVWQRHVIDDQVGPSIQFSVIEGFFGDDRIIGIGSNHSQTTGDEPDPWESAVYLYEKPNDPKMPWTNSRKISQNIVSTERANQAAPGIFSVGDANGNGRNDILLSGDGDPRVFLLLQEEGEAFSTWVLDENLPQAGSMKIVDFDGDGQNELLVTSYDQNVIHLYYPQENGGYPLRLAEQPAWANGGQVTGGMMQGGTETPAGEMMTGGTMGGSTSGELIPSNEDLTISYTGTETGPLVVGAFSSWPPLGPPSAFEQIPNPSFPVSLSFSQLSAGNYTVLAFIDVDNSGPMAATDADVQNRVEVSFPVSSNVVIDLDPVEIDGVEQVSDSVSRGTRVTPVTAYIPQGNEQVPMIVFTPGFQLQAIYYAPLLKALAQQGYLVLLADPPANIFDANHIEMAADVRAVIDWALASSFSARIDEDKIATMGHSLGGKLALFNAAEDPRVGVTLALDPVDGDPSPLPNPAQRPTLADNVLSQINGVVGLIGELTNGESQNAFAPACAPLANNFQTIFSALTNASWLVEWELVGADHMDFVAECPGGLFSACSACEEGTMDPARVRSLTLDFATAFFAFHLKGNSSQEESLLMSSEADVNVRQR